MQSSAGVLLDTGSKSTTTTWYPRLNELIEDGGLASIASSNQITGPAAAAFCANQSELFDLIERRLTDQYFNERVNAALKEQLESRREEFRIKLEDIVEEQ